MLLLFIMSLIVTIDYAFLCDEEGQSKVKTPKGVQRRLMS